MEKKNIKQNNQCKVSFYKVKHFSELSFFQGLRGYQRKHRGTQVLQTNCVQMIYNIVFFMSFIHLFHCIYHDKLCKWSPSQSLLRPQPDFNLTQNKSLGTSISHFPFINSSTASLPISSLDLAAYPLPATAIPSWLWILSIYGLLLGATSTTQLSPW